MKTELERYKEVVRVAQAALRELSTLGGGNSAGNEYAQAAAAKVNTILNPPPEVEEVEVVRWECPKCARIYKDINMLGSARCCDTAPLVKLTGTYTRPKPQPVEKSVSVEVEWREGMRKGVVDLPVTFPLVLKGDADAVFELIGKRGTLTFTWTEPAE